MNRILIVLGLLLVSFELTNSGNLIQTFILLFGHSWGNIVINKIVHRKMAFRECAVLLQINELFEVCFFKLHFALRVTSHKKWMIQSLFGWNSWSWVHSKHFPKKINAQLIYFTNVSSLNCFQSMNLWKLHAYEFLIFQKEFVVLGSQRSETFLNQVKLIEIILSSKKRLSINHLCNNAGYCPDINRLIIIVSA